MQRGNVIVNGQDWQIPTLHKMDDGNKIPPLKNNEGANNSEAFYQNPADGKKHTAKVEDLERQKKENFLYTKSTRPKYENPGHHDPNSPEFRGGGSKKTETIPSNHQELWEKAIPDLEGPLTNNSVAKNWYSKDANGAIHRFQNDHNQVVHWSGSSAGASGLTVPNHIKKSL